jgi:oxygen-dependent protoporphyrinogen oxidase
MVAATPRNWFHRNTKVSGLARKDRGWSLEFSTSHGAVQRECFDAILMAAPVHITGALLAPVDPDASALMRMEASSAVIVAFGFDHAADAPVPPGFGFLVSPGNNTTTRLMACTFMDQKFPDRVPSDGRLLRAFFGGDAAERLMRSSNDEAAAIARMELAHILGPLAAPRVTVVRRLPLSLPQYCVGHLERMAELDARINALEGLHLLGNAYRGVGLPDLIRDARAVARSVLSA